MLIVLFVLTCTTRNLTAAVGPVFCRELYVGLTVK
jgi:hypothetical protein